MSEVIETGKNKHFLLSQSRLKKAQKLLGTKTETETIEIALERVITEAEKIRLFLFGVKENQTNPVGFFRVNEIIIIKYRLKESPKIKNSFGICGKYALQISK